MLCKCRSCYPGLVSRPSPSSVFFFTNGRPAHPARFPTLPVSSVSIHNLYTHLVHETPPRPLTQMIRQQEIRNPLLDLILVPTIPTHHLPLHDLRLQQQRMQIPHQLLIADVLPLRFRSRYGREPELLRQNTPHISL